MKRKKPLVRKTPLRGNPETTRDWKNRTAAPLPVRSEKRRTQERAYYSEHSAFLAAHPVCPVTGGKTTEIHHSARRHGQWLNLKRYWIAVSAEGHRVIEENGDWAASVGLMVRIAATYKEHMEFMRFGDIDPDEPLFYARWDGKKLLTPPKV